PTARRLGVEADLAGLLVLMFGGLVVAFFGAAGLAAYHHHSIVTRASLAYSAGAMLSSLGAAAAAIRLFDRSLPLFPLPFAFALVAVPALAGDRKSTRLNSSHGSISYAVFCLKKKKMRTTCNDSCF